MEAKRGNTEGFFFFWWTNDKSTEERVHLKEVTSQPL